MTIFNKSTAQTKLDPYNGELMCRCKCQRCDSCWIPVEKKQDVYISTAPCMWRKVSEYYKEPHLQDQKVVPYEEEVMVPKVTPSSSVPIVPRKDPLKDLPSITLYVEEETTIEEIPWEEDLMGSSWYPRGCY